MKNQLAEDDGLLPRLLRQYQEQFERVRLLGEQQAARQALLSFADLEPEPTDEP